jgi:arginine/ornithine transport system permease protein
MTYLAKQASAASREPFTFFVFVAVLFLLYTSGSLWVLRRVEQRFSLGVQRAEV